MLSNRSVTYSPEQVLWALGSLCALHQKPFAAELVAPELPSDSPEGIEPWVIIPFRTRQIANSYNTLASSVEQVMTPEPGEPSSLVPQRQNDDPGEIDIQDLGSRYSEQHSLLYGQRDEVSGFQRK